MPLTSIWKKSPSDVLELSIEQVTTMAGNGVLKDASACSEELRAFLSEIPSDKIGLYVDHCLTSPFAKSGLVLQDLINELGRRLDFGVVNGRYQGTQGAIGFDGLWTSPEGAELVIEIKTTDAYRISLDVIASYREKLRSAGRLKGEASILVIVGRDDTGELEAQIRGSRHAWDIRLISAEALKRLVHLKENSDIPETGRKIRSLLQPLEYTRLDKMVDVLFTTAKDVEGESSADLTPDAIDVPDSTVEKKKGVWQFTERAVLDNKRGIAVRTMSTRIGVPLLTKSRALYWDAGHSNRIVCIISKHYERSGYDYWYAFHPGWETFLDEATNGFAVLGCVDRAFAFAIPWAKLKSVLSFLNTTTTSEDYTYRHIHLTETVGEGFSLRLPKAPKHMLVEEYRFALMDHL